MFNEPFTNSTNFFFLEAQSNPQINSHASNKRYYCEPLYVVTFATLLFTHLLFFLCNNVNK